MVIAATALPHLVGTVDDPETGVGPGLVAFLIVALLGVATFLLIRSMLRHIKNVPPSFDPSEPERPTSEPERPTSEPDQPTSEPERPTSEPDRPSDPGV